MAFSPAAPPRTCTPPPWLGAVSSRCGVVSGGRPLPLPFCAAPFSGAVPGGPEAPVCADPPARNEAPRPPAAGEIERGRTANQ